MAVFHPRSTQYFYRISTTNSSVMYSMVFSHFSTGLPILSRQKISSLVSKNRFDLFLRTLHCQTNLSELDFSVIRKNTDPV